MNRLQELAQPMLDSPPHRAPDLATLDARVRRRARRRQGARALTAVAGLLVAGTALIRPLPAETAVSPGGTPAATALPGGAPGLDRMGFDALTPIPPETAPPGGSQHPDFQAAVELAFPDGVYRPGDLTGRPLVEVRVEPVEAPADAVRTFTFVNRGSTELDTCAVDLARWVGGDRFDERVTLGILPDRALLMARHPNDDLICPDPSGIPHQMVPPGGSVHVTRRLGSVVDWNGMRGPLQPGTYVITRFRESEPMVLGRFTVTEG